MPCIASPDRDRDPARPVSSIKRKCAKVWDSSLAKSLDWKRSSNMRADQFRRVQPGRQPRRHRVVRQDGAGLAGRHRRPHRRAQGARGQRRSPPRSARTGTRVVTASRRQDGTGLERRHRRPGRRAQGARAPVSSAAFSPDGSRVVTASEDKTARVWNADTGGPHRRAQGPRGRSSIPPRSARTGTGRHRLGTRRRGSGRPPTGALIAELKGHTGDVVTSAAFSPDGGAIVTASDDKTARVWRADTGASSPSSRGMRGEVDFRRVQPGRHPRRHRLSGQDGADLAADTGPSSPSCRGTRATCHSAAFSPDGDARRHRLGGQDGAGLAGRHGRPHRRAQGAPDESSSPPRSARTGPGSSPRPRTGRRGSGRPTRARSSPSSRGTRTRCHSAAFSPDGTRVVTASMGQDGAGLEGRHRRTHRRAQGAHGAGRIRRVQPGRSRGSSPRPMTDGAGLEGRHRRSGRRAQGARGHGQLRRVQPGRDARRHRLGRRDGAGLEGRHRRPHRRAQGARGLVHSAAFSPDGTRVVTASQATRRRGSGRPTPARSSPSSRGTRTRSIRRVQPGRQPRRHRVSATTRRGSGTPTPAPSSPSSRGTRAR